MLKHNYLELIKDIKGIDHFLWFMALTLERKGTQFCERWVDYGDVSYLDNAICMFKSSIVLSENFAVSYFQLCNTFAAKGDSEQSEKYLKLGKMIYKRMSDSAAELPFHETSMLEIVSPEMIKLFESNRMRILDDYNSGAL